MDLLTFLKAIFPKLFYDVTKWIVTKKLMNPDSIFYYKKIVEKLKIAWFAVKVYIALAIFKRISTSGMFRSASKDLELKIAIAVVLVTIVAIVATVYRDDKKKLD